MNRRQQCDAVGLDGTTLVPGFPPPRDETMATYLYELYLRGFPKHEKAGTILYYLLILTQRRD